MQAVNQMLAYRIPEWAEAMRISRSKAYQLIKEGRGPRVTHIDGCPVITLKDAQSWLEAQHREVA